jgi:outer membrane biosynthesis protein TonB
MASLINLQMNGGPVILYGLVGITTAVLAYATAGGAFGNAISNAKESLESVSPAAALAGLSPFNSTPEQEQSTPVEEPEPEPEPVTEPDAPPPTEDETPPQEGEIKGGKKKRHKKTPRKRAQNKRNKTNRPKRRGRRG